MHHNQSGALLFTPDTKMVFGSKYIIELNRLYDISMLHRVHIALRQIQLSLNIYTQNELQHHILSLSLSRCFLTHPELAANIVQH